MKKFKTEILIRDKRLDYMQEAGLVVDYETLSDNDFIKALKEKLIEESIELSQAKDEKEFINELADVVEVLNTIIKTQSINPIELDIIKKQKFDKMGGFAKKIKTHSVSVPDNHPHAAYYLSHQNKYPEIE